MLSWARKLAQLAAEFLGSATVRTIALVGPIAAGSIVYVKQAPENIVVQQERSRDSNKQEMRIGTRKPSSVVAPLPMAGLNSSSEIRSSGSGDRDGGVPPQLIPSQLASFQSSFGKTVTGIGAWSQPGGLASQKRRFDQGAGSQGGSTSSDSAAVGGLTQASRSAAASLDASTASSSDAGAASDSTASVAPVLTVPANRSFPLDGSDEPILQGTAYTFSSSAADPQSDTITYGCTYQTPGLDVADPNYASAGTACASLPSLVTTGGVLQVSTASFSTSTGALTWQPTNRQRGTYKFTVTASDPNGNSDTESFYVTVRENFTTSNLLLAYDAKYSDAASGLSSSVPSAPRLDGTSADGFDAWFDLMGTFDSTLNGLFSTAMPWSGSGTASAPYALTFGGAADRLDAGSVLSSATKMMFSAWIRPSDVSLTDRVIFSTGGGPGSGFALRQGQNSADKLELVVGKGSYSDLILGGQPHAYWRFNEANGAIANDSSGNALHLTYAGVTYGSTGALLADSDSAIAYTGTNASSTKRAGTEPTFSYIENSGVFAIEAWAKLSNTANYSAIANTGCWTAIGEKGFLLYFDPATKQYRGFICDGTNPVNQANTGANSVTDTNWHHVVFTGDGTSLRIYLDGVLMQTMAIATFGAGNSRYPLYVGSASHTGVENSRGWFNGSLDEVAMYMYPLSAQQVKNHYEAGKNAKFPDNAIMAKGPVSYYRFDETSGATLYDSTVSGLNGSYTAGSYKLDMRGAKSDSVDGAAQLTRILGENVTFNLPNDSYRFIHQTGKFTVSAWFNPILYNDTTDTVARAILGSTINFGGRGFLLRYRADTSIFQGFVSNGAAWVVAQSAAIADNNWHHIAWVGDGSNMRIYLDGVAGLDTALTTLSAGASTSLAAWIGTSAFRGYFRLDDLAVFNRALTAAEIAALRTTSTRYKCQSPASLANGVWQFVTGLWDGTSAKFYVNGQLQCSVTPGTLFTPSTDLSIGAAESGANFWQGSIANAKFYGTSDGSVAGSATEAKADFDATANEFRSVPVEDIVTSNLVFHLDAANANRGLGAFANGCASSDQRWQDLSTNGFNATLYGFSGCGAASGWNGAGTAADPYRLTFDAVDDQVAAPHQAALNLSSAATVEVWVRPANAGVNAVIIEKAASAADFAYFLWYENFRFQPYLKIGATDVGGSLDFSFTANTWYHVAYTYDAATATFKGFVNGAEVPWFAQVGWGALGGNITASTGSLYVGNTVRGGNKFNGSIGGVRVYNAALTAAQISQNCKAQGSRFGVTCN